MNAVIYARYSSDSQREESIDDQIKKVPRELIPGIFICNEIHSRFKRVQREPFYKQCS